MAEQNSEATTLSRSDLIEAFFDRGQELMEKLGCRMFLLVSEDGMQSEYMGSEDFLREFYSCGLKVKPQDVPRKSVKRARQPAVWIHPSDRGRYDQEILYSSGQNTTPHSLLVPQSIDSGEAVSMNPENGTRTGSSFGTRVGKSQSGDSGDQQALMGSDGNWQHQKIFLRQRRYCNQLEIQRRTLSMENPVAASNEGSSDLKSSSAEHRTLESDDGDDAELPGHQNGDGEEVAMGSCEGQYGIGARMEKRDLEMKDGDRDTDMAGFEIRQVTDELPGNQNDEFDNRTLAQVKYPIFVKRGKRMYSEKEDETIDVAKKRNLAKRKNQKFNSEEELDNHREKLRSLFQEFNESEQYVCGKCGRSFKQVHGLEIHQVKGLCSECKCQFCGKSFPVKEWQEHLLEEHAEKMLIYDCHLCGKQFVHRSKHYHHVQNHDVDQRPHTCGVCGATFKWHYSLTKHLQKHQGVSVKCQFCDYEAVTQSDLKKHEKKHTNDKYDCKYCGKSLTSEPSLHRHIERYHVKSKYKCNICEKQFSMQPELRAHMLRRHQENPELHKCEKCGKGFLTAILLKAHVRVIHSENPVQCEICGKKFKHISKLKVHMPIHFKSEFQNHQCDLCPRKFLSRPQLNVHVRSVHSDERPFKCEKCNYSCKLKGNLTKHMKTHKGPSEPAAEPVADKGNLP